jgi:hypothetical protein
MFRPWEGLGVLSPTKVNFCSFWVPFIYRWWFVVVSPFLLIFCLMKFFPFHWKTYFVEKAFLINFCSFYSLFREKENNSLNLFGFLRLYSLACYLYDGEKFSAIFNNIHTFKNLDKNSSVQFSFTPPLFDLK